MTPPAPCPQRSSLTLMARSRHPTASVFAILGGLLPSGRAAPFPVVAGGDGECPGEVCGGDSVSLLMTRTASRRLVAAAEVGSGGAKGDWQSQFEAMRSEFALLGNSAIAGANKTYSYKQENDRCPMYLEQTFSYLLRQAMEFYRSDPTQAALLLRVFGLKDWNSPVLKPVIDDFSMAYYFLVRSSMTGPPIPASDLGPPRLYGPFDMLRIGSIGVPSVDIDSPDIANNSRLMENVSDAGRTDEIADLLPHIADTMTVCLLGKVSNGLPWKDHLNSWWKNRWATVAGDAFATKKHYILSFWKGYKLADGTPAWPKEEVNWNQFYFKQDRWDDALEQALVMGSIATHRVTTKSLVDGGQRLPFAVLLNDPYSSLEVRPGFGRYGMDMYFTEDGIPALAVTPDGRKVRRGDKDWQYCKFVWRATLFSVTTLVDHLHMSHYRVANVLATASRHTLPPGHAVRHFLSVFTHGTIKVNYLSIFMLQDPRGALSRALPFKNFAKVNEFITSSLPSPVDVLRPFFNKTAFNELPAALRDAPYYSDGKLIADALLNLMSDYLETFGPEMCHETTDEVNDKDVKSFIESLIVFFTQSGYQSKFDGSGHLTCEHAKQWLAGYLFIVTVFHRHVGQVGDFASDPDLVAFSWKQGESFGRPSQAFITAAIAGATGSPRPKLLDDYWHVFQGMRGSERFKGVWQRYQDSLVGISQEVARRNTGRKHQNLRADPRYVETTVAV